MKFIHTADIHLDSPLTGLTAYEDAPAELLRTATRDAFTRLIDEAISEEVDFMVIAGDLYDGTWKDYKTGIFFCREMGRLNQVGIPVYLLYGNHDAESEMTKNLQLPANVHAFPHRSATTFKIESLKVALHGRSFKDAATIANLVPGYPAPEPGWLNIGVLHTALEGNTAHPNYAPCSLAELDAKRYQYWALGHVHEHRIWRQGAAVVFPGNLQERHIRETGPRGAVMVTAEDGQIESIDRLIVDVLRWHHLEVDASAAQSLADVVRLSGDALTALVACATKGVPLAVRASITGRSHAHGDLFGLEHQLRAEILGLAAAIGSDKLWVEKVKVETTEFNDPDEINANSGAIADLRDLLATVEQDPDFMLGLRDELMQMAGKVPLELFESVPVLADIRSGNLQGLVRETVPGLLAHLAKAGVNPS